MHTPRHMVVEHVHAACGKTVNQVDLTRTETEPWATHADRMADHRLTCKAV